MQGEGLYGKGARGCWVAYFLSEQSERGKVSRTK